MFKRKTYKIYMKDKTQEPQIAYDDYELAGIIKNNECSHWIKINSLKTPRPKRKWEFWRK